VHTRAIESIESFESSAYHIAFFWDSIDSIARLLGWDKDDVDDDSERTSGNGCPFNDEKMHISIWPAPLGPSMNRTSKIELNCDKTRLFLKFMNNFQL
jgi:hypothetical protein